MPSAVHVRAMTFEDIDRVYEIEREIFPNPWPKSFFESDLGLSRNVGLVAELDGRVVGYALAACADIEFHVTNVGVDARCQRRGIASRLMDELEAIARERGCHHAYLEVRVDNFPAIELYLKLGFAILYTRRCYYLDGTDANVMYKKYSVEKDGDLL